MRTVTIERVSNHGFVVREGGTDVFGEPIAADVRVFETPISLLTWVNQAFWPVDKAPDDAATWAAIGGAANR